jgi:hypothetical protein
MPYLHIIRKILAFLFLLTSYNLAYNQVITGTVLDKNTRAPVGFAMLYFNGSFVGTYSDENGKFELDVSKHAYAVSWEGEMAKQRIAD